MKKFATYDEIENLCEALIKDFMKRKHDTNAHCVDIEAFVTEYLGIPIVYKEIFKRKLVVVRCNVHEKYPQNACFTTNMWYFGLFHYTTNT